MGKFFNYYEKISIISCAKRNGNDFIEIFTSFYFE